MSTMHDTNARGNRRRMGAKVLEGITRTRQYATRTVQTFLETCKTNPRIAVLAATPALLVFLFVLAFLIISALRLVLWAILTIMIGMIFVIIRGLVSLFFKLLVMMLATIPLVAIGTGLLVGANMLSQSIIRRISQNGVTPTTAQPVRETDWNSVVERLTDIGKNLGPGSVAIWEGSLVLRTALYDAFVAIKSGIMDVHNTRVESLPNDPPSDRTVETSGEPSQGNSNSVDHTESMFEYTELGADRLKV